jgi:hypothetical protein
MPKLHELLAVEGNLKAQADKTRNELMGTFQKKSHHFTEKTVSYKPFDEKEQTVVESQLDLQSTIVKELRWISEFLTKALDVSYQVAEANTTARADVLLDDGTTLLANIPATALLELEKRAKELHDFITAIPTLDPAKGFKADPERGEDVYRARDDKRPRTKKSPRVITLAPPTQQHPAQVQLIQEDVPVGETTTIEWSGLITVAAKGDMLSRVERLARAVKQARSRANEVQVAADKNRVGAAIISYVFGI